jgi:hypothetical protein
VLAEVEDDVGQTLAVRGHRFGNAALVVFELIDQR